MLDRNSDALHTSADLLTLPVASRIEYSEKILDDVARSVWGETFVERDQRKMESVASEMFRRVKRIKELALQILEED